MKMMYVTYSAGTASLSAGEAPSPKPASGELLIEVKAAGVTPTELSWYPTSHTQSGEARMKPIPGHEFSGVIAGVGQDAAGWTVGQEIFGMNGWFSEGAMAEYCTAPASGIALKPAGLSHVEAASVPIGALTAAQGLDRGARLQAGDIVLVHGGAGAVGLYAIQLAKLRGAHVIVTASARNLDFVTSLGADQAVDYHEVPFEARVGSVDVVFDTVGGETLERSWRVLKPQGRMVTIAAPAENSADPRVQNAFFIVEPDGRQLTEIAGLLAAGKLRPVVDAIFPFSQAPEVFADRVVRRGRGKLVVEIAA